MKNIKKYIINIISERFNLPKYKILLNLNFYKDYNLNSIDVIELIMIIEYKYKIKISEKKIKKIKNIKNILKYIKKYKKK